ncbi:MAG: hypothetical protein HUJ16_13445 [Kangiella sp.]|nr:hypothetical protein [Kangiella sp.]
MGYSLWIKRFITILTAAFIVIAGAQYLKNNDLSYALLQGAIWAPITATLFTVSRFFQAKRGQHCALCKDTPEMRDES